MRTCVAVQLVMRTLHNSSECGRELVSSGLWLLVTVVCRRFEEDGLDLDARVTVLAGAMEAVLCCHIAGRHTLTGLVGAAWVGVHRQQYSSSSCAAHEKNC